MISASEYVRQNYQLSDYLAVLVLNRERGEKRQPIRTAEVIAGEELQAWMRYKNAKGSDVYISQNALREHALGRTKADILAVRHVYLDLDRDGEYSLATIRASRLVPESNFIINTSPGKYQVIWKVEGMTPEQAEGLQRAMVREFGGDPATTDCTRVLRRPGFYNKKYEPNHLIEGRLGSAETFRLESFKLSLDQPRSQQVAHQQAAGRSHQPSLGQIPSDHDWGWVQRRLREGQSIRVVIERLMEYRDDKPNPEYYARRTVTRAYARVAVARGDHPEQVVRAISAYPPQRYQSGEQYARETVQEALSRLRLNPRKEAAEGTRHRSHNLGLEITP